MASSWKKITDKVDGVPLSGPHASDWEAMNAKIAAHPSVSDPKGKGGFWLKTGLGVLLLGVLGVGYLMYSSSPDGESDSIENSMQVQSPVIEPRNRMDETYVVNKPDEKTEPNERNLEVNAPIPVKISEPAVVGGDNKEEVSVPVATVVEKELTADGESNIVNIAEGVTHEADKTNEVAAATITPDPERNVNTVKAWEPGAQEAEANEGIVEVQGQSTDENLAIFQNEIENIEGPDDDELVAEGQEFTDSQKVVGEVNESLNGDSPILLEETENNTEPIVVEEATEKVTELPEQLDKEVIEESMPDLVQNDDEESSAPADPIDLRSAGFSINGLNIGAGYSTEFSGNLYGTGIGLDVDIQRGSLLLNTGVHYSRMNTLSKFINYTSNTNYNTTFNTVWDTTVTTVQDSVWVIDSAYSGHWADKSYTTTTISSSTDTIQDSTVTKIETTENRRVKLSYIEIPVMVGHRFRFNRFAVDIFGGVVLNQLTTGTMDGVDIEKKFGMDAVLQPAVRFYVKPKWSVFGRAGLRYGLVANTYRPQKLYSNFQIGLTYHW